MADDSKLQITLEALDKASAVIQNASDNIKRAMGDVENAQAKTKSSNESLATSVFAGVASWDMLKAGLQEAQKFLMECAGAAMEDQKAIITLNNVLNQLGTGLSNTSPQIKEFEDKMLSVGWTAGETDASLTKLIRASGSVEKAMFMSKLAADLTRSGFNDLETNTQALANLYNGKMRTAMQAFGLDSTKVKNIAEALEAIMGKLNTTSEQYATTIPGQMEVATAQIEEMKSTIGAWVVEAEGWFATIFNNVVKFDKNFDNEVIKNNLEYLQKHRKLTEEEQKALDDVNGKLKENTDITKEQTKAKKTLAEILAELKTKQDAEAQSTAVDDQKKALTKLSETYQKLKSDALTSLNEMKDAWADKSRSIQENIDKTKKSIDDLTNAYNKTRTSDTASVAEQIVASEEKIKDIKSQLASASTDDQRTQLEKQLEEEQRNYDSSLDFRLTHIAEIAEAERRASMTSLQRNIEDYNTKRIQAEKEYQDKLSDLQKQLKAYQDEYELEEAEYKIKTLKIQIMEAQATKDYVEQSKARMRQTADEVNAGIQQYSNLLSSINAVKSASASNLMQSVPSNPFTSVPFMAEGGVVTKPTIAVIGEAGPEAVVPLNGRSPVGGIVINIQGGYYLDRDAAQKMGDLIIEKLKMNYKI